MVTLDMTDKDRSVAVKEDLFSTETGILTLQISLGTYDLTGKTVTAVFSETGVETGVLTVTAGIIQLPIVAGYVERGTNNIQLNIRLGLTLEQSPIMVWQILQPVSATDPADSDVDVITWLLNSAIDSKNAADAVVASFEEDLGEGHILQTDLQASIATGTPLLSDLQDANSTAGGLLTDLTTPSTGAIDVATAINTTLTDTTIPAAQSIEQTLRVTTTPAATAINNTLTNTTIPNATSINNTLVNTTTPAATSINSTLVNTTTPAATSINNTLANTTIPLAQATETSLNLAIAAGSVDTLQEKVGTIQNEVKTIEDTILQMNPNGDAKITVTSYDTVNSLPKNAAQAGLGVVQEGMTATNLTDGDFSATADWTSTFATFTVSNGVGSVLADAQNDSLQQALTAIATHKYYIQAMVKLTTGSVDVALRFNDGTNTTDTPTVSSTAWQKVSAIITAGASGAGFVGLVDKRASAWDTIQIKEFRTVNLTARAQQALTLSQADSMLLDYFSGTQSAVTGRVRSVGKNLFDAVKIFGYIASDTIMRGTATVVGDTLKVSATSADAYTPLLVASGQVPINKRKYLIKVKPNSQYRYSRTLLFISEVEATEYLAFYDSNFNYISFTALVNNTTGNKSTSFTTPLNCSYVSIRFGTASLGGSTTYSNIQLELGTVATPYEPYRKTESYTKPMLLRRLPNNTTDDVTNGKHTKRVSEWANVTGASFASIDNATYTNVSVVKTTAFSLAAAGTTAIDNSIIYRNKNNVVLAEVAQADIDNLESIGKFYYHTDKTVWRILAKGSDDIATARTALGTETMIYQLLTPIITENVSSGTLLAYPSGTVYWEPVIADVAIYAAGASILNTGYPISTLESIYKIDLVTGEQTPLDVASATVASGGLSFTHTGLVDGDMVGFTYYFAHALPYGENDYIYYDSRETAIDTVTAKVYRYRPVVTNGVVVSWALTEVV